MQCPKCGSDVPRDERECPICFAPLSSQGSAAPTGLATPKLRTQREGGELAAGIPGLDRRNEDEGPRPNYLNADTPMPSSAGMGGGQVRVSLTGEVIEGPPPSVAGAPGPYTPQALRQPPPGPGPSAPRGPAAVRSPHVTRPQAEEPARGGKTVVTVIALLVLVMAIAGAGAFWFLTMRTNPRDQALVAYRSITAQDWRTLYTVVAFSEKDKAEFPNADAFAKRIESDMDKTPVGAMAKQILGSFTNVAVGEPVKTDAGVDVPTSAQLSMGNTSVSFSGRAHMINQMGIWKLDGRSGDSDGLIRDLIGQPQGGLPGMPGLR